MSVINGCDSDIDEFDYEAEAEKALACLLPEKSKEKYEKAYGNFKKWSEEKKLDIVNEKVMLAYYSSEMAKYKSSTTWTNYSMLKATLNLKENVDISSYNQLLAFLKRKSDGYQAKKTKVLTKEDCFTFIKEAGDTFLPVKVNFYTNLEKVLFS